MRILGLNTFDQGGGAETVAMGLHEEYRKLGHSSLLAVRRARSQADGVIEISQTRDLSPPARQLMRLAAAINPRSGMAATLMKRLARPRAAWEIFLGHENFDFPATADLPALMAPPPDILHAHNLHGNYFDLRQLPALSAKLPVVLTLHDAWLASGHCAHSFGCDHWLSGCGQCPDLSIYPPIRRDATAFNWRRKQDILARSRLYVASPSDWLMERMKRSILAPAIADSQVIHNGIGDAFFAPPDRLQARRQLGLDPQAVILLFTANTIRANEWKDFATLRQSLAAIAEAIPERQVLLLALGDRAPEEWIGKARLVYVPFTHDQEVIVRHYQAADLYLHAARIETFSLTIAEAQASGTPVVATDAGAVRERILCANRHGLDRATGMLVGSGDAKAMAKAALAILGSGELADALARNGRRHAERSYRRTLQAERYLSWFETILALRS